MLPHNRGTTASLSSFVGAPRRHECSASEKSREEFTAEMQRNGRRIRYHSGFLSVLLLLPQRLGGRFLNFAL